MKMLIIDPQYDFHDVPPAFIQDEHQPALAVPGAWEDSNRLAQFIEENQDSINEVFVTLDTHAVYDIGHAAYWINEEGVHPEPFTVITLEDLQKGTWKTVDNKKQPYVLEYAKSIQDNNKMPIMVWPNHCLENTAGYEIVPQIKEALSKLSVPIHYIKKGQDVDAEHYGAIQAEHVINDYTDTNTELLEQLKGEKILVGGQALSHCLGATIEQIIDNMPTDEYQNIVLLRNTTSAVPSFEEQAEELVKNFEEKGIQVINV